MDTVIFSLSLSPTHILPHGAHSHVCIPSSQPPLSIHVQHCVSSNQARTTAVPGPGIPELELCWMEVVLYKVYKYFICYSIYYSFDFFEAKQENNKNMRRSYSFLIFTSD